MSEKEYYVYIMASRKGGAVYVGVTNDLEGRIYDHKHDCGSKHVSKYKIYTLVYYDVFPDIRDAIEWEKRLKRWPRAWKNTLVEEKNPNWEDLSASF